MELSEFLRQLEPVTKGLEAKVKTDSWLHKGQRFRKVEIIWTEAPDRTGTSYGLEVLTPQTT